MINEEREEFTAKEEYQNGIHKYNLLNKKLKRPSTSEDYGRLKLNDERHELHLTLNSLGANLGKNEDEVIGDILLDQLSLEEEYGLDIPLQILELEPGTQYETFGAKLFDSSGRLLGKSKGTYRGIKNAGEISLQERWQNKKYVILIYQQEKGANIYAYNPEISPQNELRREKLNRAATNFGLNIVEIDRGGYHLHWTFRGIEVPIEKLGTMAEAIAGDREKYWLS